MGKLDPDDPRPPYVQVADRYRHAIECGDLKPGDKLPAHHLVVADLGVSLGVVKRAYGLLQQEGVIVTRQGQGAFVRTRPVGSADADRDDLAAVKAAVADLGRRVSDIESRLAQISR